MDEIPTPRTDCHAFDLDVKGDAKVVKDKYSDGDYVQSDFARRLERELTIAKQALEEMADCDWHEGNCSSIEIAAKRVRHMAKKALSQLP